jgi:Undecaprenyl-phosphate glucose phosphotransferase
MMQTDDPRTDGVQRGPMRPKRLVTARANRGKRLSSHVFRCVDVGALAVVTAVVVGRHSSVAIGEVPLGGIVPLVVGTSVVVRALRALSLYRFMRGETFVVHMARTALAAAIGALVAMVLNWSFGDHGQSDGAVLEWLAVTAGMAIVLHALWWTMVWRWRAQGWLLPNIFLVGATEHAEQLISEALVRRHVNVLGVFDDRLSRSPGKLLGVPVLGDLDALVGHRMTPFVDLIVITVEPTATRRAREIQARLSSLPNEVTLFIETDHAVTRAAALDRLESSPLAPLHGASDHERRAFAKRVQDLVIGVPLLVLVSPILAIVALAVRLDSPGSAFFRQRRHGFNNEEILVWKFRTMYSNASDARAERQVTVDDPRVTRLGRLLRKTSVDELPQLINVIRGEMSLVGPRPHAIGMKTGDVESALLVAEYAHRHRIKPGITGWAAIKGSRGPLHAAAEVQRRVALDIEYIARQSFWLDLRILGLTVPGLIGDRGTIR